MFSPERQTRMPDPALDHPAGDRGGQLLRCRPGSEIEKRLFFDRRLLTDYRLTLNLEVKNDPRQSKLLFLRRDHPLARKQTVVSRIVF